MTIEVLSDLDSMYLTTTVTLRFCICSVLVLGERSGQSHHKNHTHQRQLHSTKDIIILLLLIIIIIIIICFEKNSTPPQLILDLS